jgi:protein tyrosine phosphatase
MFCRCVRNDLTIWKMSIVVSASSALSVLQRAINAPDGPAPEQQWTTMDCSTFMYCLFNTPHEVNHFQIHGWSSDGAPGDTTTTTELAEMLNKQYMNVEQSIVVHCCSGAGPSGAFIALCNTLSALEAETTIDIFQIVKSLRTQRQNMVKTNEQYTFIFRAVQRYLAQRSSESYANYPYTT